MDQVVKTRHNLIGPNVKPTLTIIMRSKRKQISAKYRALGRPLLSMKENSRTHKKNKKERKKERRKKGERKAKRCWKNSVASRFQISKVSV